MKINPLVAVCLSCLNLHFKVEISVMLVNVSDTVPDV